MDWLYQILDIGGIIAFAVSGAVMAMRKELDLFGVCFLAFMPAVGGGTIRDLLIGAPIFWMEDSSYILIVLATAIICFFLPKIIHGTRHIVRWADAAGLAIFAVVGTAKTWALIPDPLVACSMGVVTAAVGGMIRDTLCNEVPMVFRTEVDLYATAAVAGSGLWLALTWYNVDPATSLWVAVAFTFLVRAGAMLFGWRLPGSRQIPDED